jgi:hypothetical protein
MLMSRSSRSSASVDGSIAVNSRISVRAMF